MMNRKPILSGLIFAALMLIGAFALKRAAEFHLVSGDIPMRGVQMIVGLMMAFSGNTVPKKLPPFREGDNGRIQALKRTIGWLLTAAGFGYAVIWASVPLSEAADSSMALVGVVTALVAVFIVRTHLAQRRASSTTG